MPHLHEKWQKPYSEQLKESNVDTFKTLLPSLKAKIFWDLLKQ